MDAGSSSVLTRRIPGLIPRRPAVPAVLFLILGIALAFEMHVHPWILLTLTAVASLSALLLSAKDVIASLLIAIALTSLGATIGQAEFFRYSPDDIGAFSSAQPRLTQLELRVDDPPRLVSSVVAGRPLPPKQVVIAPVERILTGTGWKNASGSILLQISPPQPFLAAGQKVRVLGMLERPAHATNPGEFDWADYYREQRVLTSMRITRTENIHILSDGGDGVVGWMRAATRDLLAMGFTHEHDADHALLRALVLGDSDPSMHESQEQFQKIGVAYLFWVHGIHIAVVTALVYGLCRLLMRSPRFAGLICMAIVILYGIVTMTGESTLRAVIVYAAVLLGILNRRQTDKLQLLAIVAGILLATEPMDLFNPGFALGFPCVAGLILLTPPLLAWLSHRDDGEEDASQEHRQRILWRAWIALRTLLAIDLVAWAVSLPIVAYEFGQLSPWTVFAGVLLFPIVTIALLGGCVKIILTLAWPSLSSWWAAAARIPVLWMKHAAATLVHLPAVAMSVAQPSLFVITIYYTLLCLPLLPWSARWLRRTAIGLAVGAFCCLLAGLSFGFTATQLPSAADDVSITFLDIGAGQCAVLQAPGAAPIMIDAGSSTVSDIVRSCLGPYLRLHGDRHIGSVFLSHSDYDHISAIAVALPIFGIDNVFTSHYFAHFASIDPPARALLDQLNRAGKSPHLIGRGDHVQLTRDVATDVLWPPADCNFNCNNTGLVLRLSYAGETVLFPADIQVDAMRELLKSPQQLKADVLVAAHHGSSEVTTSAFVSAVDPKFIISSNGSPLTEKQKRFEQMIGGRPLYRTSKCGAITLHIKPNGSISVETFVSPRPVVTKN